MRGSLRQHAIEIWQAGVDAVQTDAITAAAISHSSQQLRIADAVFDIREIGQLLIVGGGKAVGGMLAGAMGALDGLSIPVQGWVNVPDAATDLDLGDSIVIHPARGMGQNEPTARAVDGTKRLLALTRNLAPHDLCLCLLTGGGSALLVAPGAPVRLEEKLAVIRALSSRGASIHELNAVRRCLSDIKGGGLARQCGATNLVTLAISDVLGDELETIASGPTVIGSRAPAAAQTVLETYLEPSEIPINVMHRLQKLVAEPVGPAANAQHFVLANLQTAVDAAAHRGRELGFRVIVTPATIQQPTAEQAGRELAEFVVQPCREPTCLISGGEPVVRLCPAEHRGRGGRNQQLVVAALDKLLDEDIADEFVMLSGGTDGEDGPTDAAGAIIDNNCLVAFQARDELRNALQENNTYPFLQRGDALLKSGWTGTNVGDLRVILRRPTQHRP